MQNTNYFAQEFKNLNAQIEQLNDRLTLLNNRRNELQDGVQRRDWSLTRSRPGADDIQESGGKAATENMRGKLYGQLRATEKELHEVRSELPKLYRRASEVRAHIERQRIDALTPCELDAHIDVAEREAAEQRRSRQVLADELCRVQGLMLQVDVDLKAEADAMESLNKARADAYLSPGNKAAVRAVGEAEQTLVKATGAATAARAAAGQIESAHREAMAALEQHDARAAELTRRVATLRTTRALLAARDSINSAGLFLTSNDGTGAGSNEGVDALGLALITLGEVAPDEVGRLSHDWGRALRDVSDRLDKRLAPVVQPFVRGGA